MNIPTELIAAVVSFLLAELGVFIGFIWKASQIYQKDREENLKFLNELKADFENKFNQLTIAVQTEVNARERCKVESRLVVDSEIQALKHKMEIEGQMNKRDIEELKGQVNDVSEKLDATQQSIIDIHRRIDELFKMIKKDSITASRRDKQ